MNKHFVLLFSFKITKKNSEGKSPIYLRISIDGERVEISTKRTTEERKWNKASQKATGNSEEARSLHLYFKTLEYSVYDAYRVLIEKKLECGKSYY